MGIWGGGRIFTSKFTYVNQKKNKQDIQYKKRSVVKLKLEKAFIDEGKWENSQTSHLLWGSRSGKMWHLQKNSDTDMTRNKRYSS
jgi:hypothetical protein